MANTLPSETKDIYASLIFTGSWQRHLDWRRRSRFPARRRRDSSPAPLTVKALEPQKHFCPHLGNEQNKQIHRIL
jgi:hypothetical protein